MSSRTLTSRSAPSDPEVTPRQRDPSRRRALAIAVVAVVILVIALVIVTTGGGDDAPTSATSSSSVPTTVAPSTTASTVATTTTVATTDPNVPPPAVTGQEPEPSALPDDPTAYATATFTAWQQLNVAALSRLAPPAVVAFLTAHLPDGRTWDGPTSGGAAGSSYCEWTRPDVGFVVRVGNESAYAGEPQAVVEVFFWTAPGRVAIWPFTTQQQADDAQAQVDQGDRPWLTDPAEVASRYARDELGWSDVDVVMVQPGGYEITDPVTSAKAHLGLAQPAGTGQGGIWAVARDDSA
jgi:hypothetical protein